MPTILVVDDEPLIRKMLVLFLEQEGFTVFTASNGLDALDISRLHADEIHLVLSDVVMPGMDGLMLARELSIERPALPVLLMSGCCENIGLNFDKDFQCLRKPFALRTLLATVQRLMAQKVADEDRRVSTPAASS